MAEEKSQLPPIIAAQIDRFSGRTWLLPPLLDWLEHGAQRIFLLTGGPGNRQRGNTRPKLVRFWPVWALTNRPRALTAIAAKNAIRNSFPGLHLSFC